MSASTFPQRFPIYYGWMNVLVAAVAMTATLPGRTHGLGLVTTPLLEDLQLSETLFAQINLWSSLLGALFCIPMGYLIDRFGVRMTGTLVTGLLAVSVLGMSEVGGPASLILILILIRGLGQSALSIVSMAMIGKWFRGRLGMAMGVFTVLLTFGFIGSILGMGEAIKALGWRGAWRVLAWALAICTPITWLLCRSTPESSGVEPDPQPLETAQTAGHRDYTVWEAIRTPAFWVFVLGTSAFNLVWSSIMLFNESILAELGFGKEVSVQLLAALTGVGLLANLVAGAIATRPRTGMLLGVGLLVLAVSLALFPSIKTMGQLWVYGGAMGFVGGLITVVHFAAWGHFYGRGHLGRIQGVAQIVSVLASAAGPLFLAWGHETTKSYLPVYYAFAIGVFVLSLAAFAVRVPQRLIDESNRTGLEPDLALTDTPVSPFLQGAQD